VSTEEIVIKVFGSSDVDRSGYAAFLRARGIRAESAPGEILQESAETAIAPQIVFIVDVAKTIAIGLVTNVAYDVAKEQLRPALKRLAGAIRDRRECDKRHIVTIRIRIDGEDTTYNLPSVDRPAAIEAIEKHLPESLRLEAHRRGHFWVNGRWISSVREVEQFESVHAKSHAPCEVPSVLSSLGSRVGKIYPCSEDSHAFIAVGDLSQDELDNLLGALRNVLPGAVLGLTERRNLIHVEFQ
jgi:hypothetical protein